jgi:hypothetical protein
MTQKGDDDPRDTTLDPGEVVNLDPNREISAVLDDLEALLKNGEVISTLTAKGINASIALVALSGLRYYLQNRKVEAAEDFATVTEEIQERLAASADRAGANGPGS